MPDLDNKILNAGLAISTSIKNMFKIPEEATPYSVKAPQEVTTTGIDLRKRLLTPEWNDYLAKERSNWVKQAVDDPNDLFGPKKVKTRNKLLDSDWEYIYSKHPEYFDPAGKYRKQIPDKYLSRLFNQGIRDATSKGAQVALPWVLGAWNPFAVAAGLIFQKGADEITNEASGGKYQDFTQFTTDKLGPVAGTIVGMVPGMVGGGAAAVATPTPTFSTQSIHENPSTITAYHRSPKAFDIKNFRLGTKHDFGLHAGSNPSIDLGNVKYKLKLQKPNVSTVDIHSNDFRHLMTDYVFKSHSENGGFLKYDFNPANKWTFVKEYVRNPKNWGSKFPKVTKNPSGNNYYIEFPEDFHFNLRRKLLKGVPQAKRKNFNVLADQILEDSKVLENNGTLTPGSRELLNTRASNLLHDNGVNVIKYNNSDYWEGSSGYMPSYIITSPDAILSNKIVYRSGGKLNYTKYFN